MIKIRNFTYQEIEEQFDVANGTARNWVTLPGIEMIPGSWPHTFRYIGTNELPHSNDNSEPIPSGNVIVLPDVPQEAIEELFRKTMADEVPVLNFNDQFSRIDVTKSLLVLESSLKSALIITNYYKELLKNEGL